MYIFYLVMVFSLLNFIKFQLKDNTVFSYSKPEKYIETSEHGLLIISVTENDAGRYDCWLGGSLLCSYNITVDTHR